MMGSTPGRRLRIGSWRVLSVAGLAAVLPLSVLLSAAPGQGHTAAAVTRAAPAGGSAPVVSTDKGKIQGKSAEGIDQFLGVPYAAPPVGALRWAAPQPVTPWHGIRGAPSYGNRCPQLASGNGPRSDTEDCLYLNVFTPPGAPAANGAAGARGLPVLVMIHGGGLVNGSGDQHDGSLIVNTDHIVVVSLNYRLGVFGFLDVPGLGTSPLTANGNYGLLDQEAALRWVQRNIGAFGGDPGRVTIAGESAGGWSMCALMSSPPARGLFSAAIMESGSCASRPAADAQAAGLAFAAQAGCTVGRDRGRLPAEHPRVHPARRERQLVVRGIHLGRPGAAYPDRAGGRVRPLHPRPDSDGGQPRRGPDVRPGAGRADRAAVRRSGDSGVRRLAPEVLQHYPFSSYPSPYTAAYAIGAIWTDSGFITGIGGCPAQNLAAQFASGTPTYLYQFDDRHAPGLNNNLPGYQWGAGHAMELAYLWPSFNNGFSLYDLLTPAQLELSRQMVVWWGAFTRYHAPVAPGQPAWPPYTSRRLMSLRPGGQSQTISAGTYAAEHQCAFWNAASRSLLRSHGPVLQFRFVTHPT